jgi:hypothetical protein
MNYNHDGKFADWDDVAGYQNKEKSLYNKDGTSGTLEEFLQGHLIAAY